MNPFPFLRPNRSQNGNNGNSHREEDPDEDRPGSNNSFIQLTSSNFFRNTPTYSPLNHDENEEPVANRSTNGPNPPTAQVPVYLNDPDDDYEPQWIETAPGATGGGGGFFANQNANDAIEQARRQRILRLALILCIVFLFMDGNNYSSYRKPPDDPNAIPPDEILLPNLDIQDIRSVLVPMRPPNFKRQNVTGFYRAEWKTILPKPSTTAATTSSRDSPSIHNDIAISHNDHIGMKDLNMNTNDSSNSTHPYDSEIHEGISVLQFRTINIFHVPDLSFVYGVNRVYESAKFQKDFSYPFQGILITSLKKLVVMPTIYRTQRLMMEISRDFNPNSGSHYYNNYVLELGDGEESEESKAAIISEAESDAAIAREGQRRLSVTTPAPTTTHRKNTFYYQPSDMLATKNASIILRHPQQKIQLRIFVQDFATAPLNFTSKLPTETDKRTFVLGEAFLSPKYKALQISHATGNSKETTSTTKPTMASMEGDMDSFNRSIPYFPQNRTSSILPKNNREEVDLTNNVYTNLNCPYFIDLTITDENPQYYQEDSKEDKSPSGPSLMLLDTSISVTTNSPGGKKSKTTDSDSGDKSSSGSNNDNNSILLKDENIPHHVAAAVNLEGYVRNCNQRYSMKGISYEAEFEIIKEKVEIYALIYTVISLLQVVFLIYQMKHASTPALCGKLSILSFLSQAVLDAVICLIHLLFATAMPQIFFSSFIWISIIKLLSFSVFQMKMAINIYQARYAQEIANEGWRGLRRRIVNLHLRFYGALLLAFILATTFSFRPWIIVFMFYSFWWPQIIYSLYAGTKPSFHPLYFYGNTLLQLFLPLYFMGCPKNFIVIFWEEFSISTDLTLAERNNDVFLSEMTCYFLIVWVTIQVVLILLQSFFGSRFCIPKRYLPFRYDYQRPIPSHLLHPTTSSSSSSVAANSGGVASETSLGMGDIETGSTLQTSSGEQFECVICYNPIYSNVNADYMITPCDHLFHQDCLRQWMNVKLECPVCRHHLPALDEEE